LASRRLSLSSSYLYLAFLIYAVVILLSQATMSIGAGVLMVALLVKFKGPLGLIRSAVGPESKRYLQLSLALLLACFLSLVWASVQPLVYSGQAAKVHWLSDMAKGWYFFWPLLLMAGLRQLKPEQRSRILDVWLGLFVALSILGVIQYFIGWPRPQGIPPTGLRYHVTLFFGHHLSAASILIFPFFALMDRTAREKNGQRKLMLAAACFVGAVAMFLTYSRTLWVALPVGILIWVLWVFPRRVAGALIAAGALGGLLLIQLPEIQDRIRTSLGIGQRMDLWMANLEFLRQRPLLGVGWHHNAELAGYYLMEKLHAREVFSGHAHNNLLDMLGGVGLAGAALWLVWNGWVLIRTYRLASGPKPSLWARGWFCAWIVFHINGLTQVNFWEGKVMHQMFWVLSWTLLEFSARETGYRDRIR